jgi:3-deoxy-manno-octulosonate cytidylyltransferase (CMP-KDO synthetase)
MMKVLGVIPSRYASSRFPGKPLADICGKSMIRRVYEQVNQAGLETVVVATDDERIQKHVVGFGGKALLTGMHHPNGTSRCIEVLGQLEQQGNHFDLVINIQGDEPFIRPEQIHQLIDLFQDSATDIGTLIHRITQAEELHNPNTVKVVTGVQSQALYFSRQAIPFVRGQKAGKWLDYASFYKHIGIYAFRADVLKKIGSLPSGKLENAEKLEQLRWLENGLMIKTKTTDYKGIGVDTPEDLRKLINKICNPSAK